jgi:hypothetical protein
MIELLFKLLIGHAMADVILQSDNIAKNKNRRSIPTGYDPKIHGPRQTVWPYFLASHSLCHGLMVMLATGRYELGIVETVLHATIDFFKCENKYGIHIDQSLHFLCKVGYIMVLTKGWI